MRGATRLKFFGIDSMSHVGDTMANSRRRSSKRGRRWLLPAALAAVAVFVLGVLGHWSEHKPRPQSDLSGDVGLPGARARTDFPSSAGPSSLRPPPPTPEQVAQEVADTLNAWRGAIARRDPDLVTKLDATFRELPNRYQSALVDSARSDGDERVRAFSTRVLGKLGRSELAAVFSGLLADASPYVRLNAAWALGELSAAGKAPPATRATVASLKRLRTGDPDGNVRSAARDALDHLK